MIRRISFGPESLKDHLERVNDAISDPEQEMSHEDAMRSIELVKARALVAIVDQLFFITEKLDSIKVRLGE